MHLLIPAESPRGSSRDFLFSVAAHHAAADRGLSNHWSESAAICGATDNSTALQITVPMDSGERK